MTRTGLMIDPSNAEQARAWDGDEGAYWAANADQFERSVARYNPAFLAAAQIEADARVLDIGCGAGETTRAAARLAASGSALGVDLSREMIEAAQRRAAQDGVANVTFEQADAQIHPFPPGAADVAISRTGAMFFGDRAAAFANIARALRPGGRLTLLVWQPPAANEWITAITAALAAGRDLQPPPPGAPGPFALSDPAACRALLAATGFDGVQVEGLREPMHFGSDADSAFAFILGLTDWMLAGLGGEERARALASLRESVAAHEAAHGVTYASATWLITAIRR